MIDGFLDVITYIRFIYNPSNLQAACVGKQSPQNIKFLLQIVFFFAMALFLVNKKCNQKCVWSGDYESVAINRFKLFF